MASPDLDGKPARVRDDLQHPAAGVEGTAFFQSNTLEIVQGFSDRISVDRYRLEADDLVDQEKIGSYHFRRDELVEQ